MAEIIGLTASLITLAGLGAKLSKTLRDASDTLNSGAEEARLLSADISVFAMALTQLSKMIPMLSTLEVPETQHLQELVEVLIPACLSLVDELSKYIGDPAMLKRKGNVWVRALGWHFRWFSQRPRVMFVKALMESFKSTTTLLLAVMDLAVVIHQGAQHDVRYVNYFGFCYKVLPGTLP